MARRRRALELNEGSLLRCCAEELHSSQTFFPSRQKDHYSQRIYRRPSLCTQSPQSFPPPPVNSPQSTETLGGLLFQKANTPRDEGEGVRVGGGGEGGGDGGMGRGAGRGKGG